MRRHLDTLGFGYDDRPDPRTTPLEVMRAQSRHIRYAKLSRSLPTGALRCTQLKELYITGDGINAGAKIFIANPLSHLTIIFDCGPEYHSIQSELETLTQLKVLSINHVPLTHSPDPLTGILNKNAGLQELILRCTCGILGFEGCRPLTNLRSLDFSGNWLMNIGLLQLIRLCPNVEILKIPEWGDTCRRACQEYQTVLPKGDDTHASPWKAVGGCVCVVGSGAGSLAKFDCVSV